MVFKKGYKQTIEHTKRIVKAIKFQYKINCNYGMKGKRHSEETKAKMSLASINKPKSKQHIENWLKSMNKLREEGKLIPWNKGGFMSNNFKEKCREKRIKQILPIKDTKIEVKIQNFLKELGIEFFTHQYIKEIEHGYQCDILIPSMNMVIECDGDYWHKYPIGREIDNIRTKELIEKGFKVLRLWEREIKLMSINSFKDKIRK